MPKEEVEYSALPIITKPHRHENDQNEMKHA